MTVSAIIPELWSAVVKEELERQIPWMAIVEDWSGEVGPPGDQVHISQIVTSFDDETAGQGGTSGAQPAKSTAVTGVDPGGQPAIADYSRGDRISYGETMSVDINLRLDVEKYWAFRLDDLDRMQTRPELMQRNVNRAMRAMARYINDRIRRSIDSSAYSSVYRGPSSDVHDAATTYHSLVLTGSKTPETDVSLATAGSSEKVLKGSTLADLFDPSNESKYYSLARHYLYQMMEAKQYADDNFWPEQGRYCMMSTQVKNRIIEYLVEKRPNLGGGVVIDDAFINGETPGKIIGFEGRTDPGILKLSPASTANTYQKMYFGMKNDGLAYAAQVQEVEGLRLQTHFADALRGLIVFGGGLIMDDRSYMAQTKVVA